jgi:hypothetical protein
MESRPWRGPQPPTWDGVFLFGDLHCHAGAAFLGCFVFVFMLTSVLSQRHNLEYSSISERARGEHTMIYCTCHTTYVLKRCQKGEDVLSYEGGRARLRCKKE